MSNEKLNAEQISDLVRDDIFNVSDKVHSTSIRIKDWIFRISVSEALSDIEQEMIKTIFEENEIDMPFVVDIEPPARLL